MSLAMMIKAQKKKIALWLQWLAKGLFLSQVIKEGDSKTIKVAFQIHLHHLLEGGPRNGEKYWIVNFPVGSASTVQFLPFKPHLLAASQFLLLSSEVLSFLQIALDAHTGSQRCHQTTSQRLGIVKVMVCNSGGHRQRIIEVFFSLLQKSCYAFFL